MSENAGSDAALAVGPGWCEALAPVWPTLEALVERADLERSAGEQILPPREHILRAFRQPFADVRVVLVGQDPYPTPGHPIGLSFAVDAGVRPLPRSLVNIYRELADDLGVEQPVHGDLSVWADQGVMLMNRVLTVRAGEPGAHRRWGWEVVTAQALAALAARSSPLVAILWGNDAASARPLLGEVPVIASAHPSPLSARRGFFGSQPFSRANALLEIQGAEPIDWAVPATAS